MINRAYIRLVWRNNRTFAIFSTVFITLFQFMMLYLVTTFDTQAMLSVILEQMPPIMRKFLEDSFFSMLTYDGAAAFGLNHPIVLTLLVMNAILIPGHHITRELESGTLEMLLAYPFKRDSLFVSLWLSGAGILLFIIAFSLAGSITSILIFHTLTVDILLRLAAICFNLWLLMLLILTYTMLIAVVSKMGVKAGNISASITFFFYLLYYLAELWQAISFTKPFNIFSYFEPQKVMLGQGNFLPDIIVLAVLVTIGFAIGLRHFKQRDIP
jgi:ABC-type transport system involved in multi-copper enzyme maturation permease subunit